MRFAASSATGSTPILGRFKLEGNTMRKLLTFLIALGALCFPSLGAMAWWQSIQQVGVSSGGSGLPLDGIATGIKAAYSTASDSTTSNIGFSSNVLNTSALGSFCSGTTCTVSIWYDQSGGGYNLTPGTAPVIYQSGAVTAINGKPAPLFASEYLLNASLTVNPVNTLYQNAVIQMTSLAAYGAITGPSTVQALEWRVDATAGTLNMISASVAGIGTSSNSVTAGVGAVVEAQYNLSTGAFSFWIDRRAELDHLRNLCLPPLLDLAVMWVALNI
jgi:hypothetical protein